MPLILKKTLRAFVDPLSLIGVVLFLTALIVGTNVVVNHGSFDIRNWAAESIEQQQALSSQNIANQQAEAKKAADQAHFVEEQQAITKGQQSVKETGTTSSNNSSNSNSKDKKTSTTKTTKTTTTSIVSKDTFGYQPTASDIKNGPTYYKSATGNDGLGFVSGTYLDNQGNRHVVDLPETQQAYKNWSAQKIEELKNTSLNDLKTKYGITADINSDTGKSELLSKMLFLDTAGKLAALNIIDQKTPVQISENKQVQQDVATVTRGNEIANEDTISLFTNIKVTDSQLAQIYCLNKEASCLQNFKRTDVLSSLTDTDKLKAQGMYEENLTNDLMKTNADYDTKVVLMQIITKFQNTSISDTTLAKDYCVNYNAWGYNSEQDCTAKFKRSDYLSIADQLTKNLSGNPVSTKSTTTNFCLDVLNANCINGCIPDTSGGKCRTSPAIIPVTLTPKTSADLAICTDATDGYCYDKGGQKIVYFDQGDPRWGLIQLPGGNDGNVLANTYSESSCGQTTLAEILASFTDPGITPVDVVKKYYSWSSYKGTGFSTASDVLTNKGYEVNRLNVSTDKLKEYIKIGGYLGFTSITFKDRNGNEHSHFTLIVDVNDKGDFVYNDPYFGKNTTLKDKGINYVIDDITLIKPPKK